jgi:CRISPR-associated protein Csd1
MSILASLAHAYDRLAERREVPSFGYSTENIGFVILLDGDGRPVGMPVDLRQGEGRKRSPRPMAVPASFKRPGVTPRSFFLWDNTAFALGVTAAQGKDAQARFAAFRRRHLAELQSTDDAGLLALRRFVERWNPDAFSALGWPEEMKDLNVVFALADEYRERMIHDRPAARALWARLTEAAEGAEAVCLVSGERRPIARLHPSVKGVWGAQPSGASLVSFNQEAFISYGHEQGDNAPVSEAAAFAYGTALNHFLAKGSRNRIQLADASVVFWADATEADAAVAAEALAGSLFADLPIDEAMQAGKVGALLAKIRAGRPVDEFRPDLPQGVRFSILGLSPNAARLSVRFWVQDDFGVIAERYVRHVAAMRIEPPPRPDNASIRRLLLETAPMGKAENIPPNLAGEMVRAILAGLPYPRTLLATLLMRLRADKSVNGLRVALLKAVLIRDQTMGKEVPVSLDPENKEPGYLLGRLFATYEYAQMRALGSKVNATIRDQYYGTASATPRAVFPVLQRKATHHLSRLRKDKPGLAVTLDRQIGEIFELAGTDLFVPTLTAQRQALFAVGYYHQRNAFFRSHDTGAAETAHSDKEPTE